MSGFIKKMFSEQKPEVMPLREMAMFSESSEVGNQYPTLINWNFKAKWQMNASGKVEDYDKIHRMALQALNKAIYGEFREQLITLELAIYAHDRNKALELLKELNRSIR